jgi:hypothetical protein
MADGSSKPIEKVQPGDTVKATNAETGVSEPQQVTATIAGGGDKQLIELTLAGAGAGGGGPPATITATAGHKFYSLDKGWIPATDLKPGDTLRDSRGRAVTVVRTAEYSTDTKVYNLTIDGVHTYYVVAGAKTVLVHNCGGAVDRHRDICNCANGDKPILKRGPKPGMLGGHNQTIKRLAQQVIDGGDDVIAGGKITGSPEARILTPGGLRNHRRPDILARRPDGSTYGINVGVAERNGMPVEREVLAINDLEEFAGLEMHFVPYKTK